MQTSLGPNKYKSLWFIVGIWEYSTREYYSEKSFSIIFGMDYHYTSEIALMPSSLLEPTELTVYCEELVLSLSVMRELVASNGKLKQGTRNIMVRNFMTRKLNLVHNYNLGEWVLLGIPCKVRTYGEAIKSMALVNSQKGSDIHNND